jgi:hypothetical protein
MKKKEKNKIQLTWFDNMTCDKTRMKCCKKKKNENEFNKKINLHELKIVAINKENLFCFINILFELKIITRRTFFIFSN